MRSTTVARLLYNPIFQKNALQGWHVQCFSYEVSPSPTPASPLSPCIQQAAAGMGCARILQLWSLSECQGTPHTSSKHKEGYWKGLINSLQRVQGVTNYFFTTTPSAVHEVQVASGQWSNLTLPGPRCWQTPDPVPQKGCKAQELSPRNQPHIDYVCSPTSTNLKELSSSLHAVWQLHQHSSAQIVKGPQHWVQSLIRAIPNYHKSLLTLISYHIWVQNTILNIIN